MRVIQFFATSFLLLGVLHLQLLNAQTRNSVEYKWKQSHIGGGYIIGLMQDPQDADIVYARCDVGGMYKSVDCGKSWKTINNGMTQCQHHSVESFAISPHNPQVLFRCSGEARGHSMVGTIHKSTNGGESWKTVSEEVDFFGNGNNRMYGEKIAVDPFDSDFVAAFGFHKGVFSSHNQGESFSFSGLNDQPAGCLAFHPFVKNRLYAGTRNRMEYRDYIYPAGKYNTTDTGKLFVSTDKGKTWTKLFEDPEIEFLDLAFEKADSQILYVASSNGIYKSSDGGKTFQRKTNGLVNAVYNCVTADLHRTGTVYAVADRPGNVASIPAFPVYKSTDFGETWNLLKADYSNADFTQYPDYIKSMEWVGWAISKLKVDVKNPDKLFTSNWFGVSTSENGGASWSGHNYQGTETVCIQNILASPLNPNKFYFTLADHQPFVTTDNGRNYEPFQRVATNPQMSSSTAACPSRFKAGYVVFGLTERDNAIHGSAIALTPDDGKTVEVVRYFSPGQYVQTIKEDYFMKGTFYAYVDGDLRKDAGIYQSMDWGKTWVKMNFTLPDYIKVLPYRKNWIESELLPVVFDQGKNVCGTNQLLCVDPFSKNTLYVGEYTEGIFKTSDNGKTWQNISANLPFGNDTATALVDIKADEKRKNVLYAGFIREGLWRTDNAGKSWTKVFPADDRIFNASSTVIGGVTKSEIYIASEPLFWSKSESALYYSPDYGKTWSNISDKSLGAIRWKGIAVNKKTGTNHGVACGNRCFYAERKTLDHEPALGSIRVKLKSATFVSELNKKHWKLKGNKIDHIERENDTIVSIFRKNKLVKSEQLKLVVEKSEIATVNINQEPQLIAEQLVWSDEFNYTGLPDSTKWGYEVGKVRNNELQYYTEKRPENARVENGNLVIQLIKEPFNGSKYTAASVTSQYKGDWTYCNMEVRAKFPAGKATWPAIWCIPTDTVFGSWPRSGEIDIMEHVGFKPGVIHATVHTSAYNIMKHTANTKTIDIPDFNTAFHNYTLNWDKKQIQIGVDTTNYFKFDNNGGDYTTWPFDIRFYLVLNIAYGRAWGGQAGIDDTIFDNNAQLQMQIDYVLVYQNIACILK
jgi:beta-glucanase (GH16 family)/photosystem II stability/assembly factor-like uncharacterized protein